jgi:hypothetical protein
LASTLGFAESQAAESILSEAAQISAMIQSLLAALNSNA